MNQYLNLMNKVFYQGAEKTDRTGTGTRSIFGHQMRFDLTAGFPILTTKKVHFKSVAVELLWFLRGETNISFLKENGVKIWDEWADENGELGPVYGKQWRRWENTRIFNDCDDADYKIFDRLGYRVEATDDKQNEVVTLYTGSREIDQIKQAIDTIKNNPDSRRIIVSAWNPGEVEYQALPPCHVLFQFYVVNGKLSCQLYQRSADVFLGVPFNIASYALLTHMIAQVCGLGVGEFIWTGGDCHLYSNHYEQAKLQMLRAPGPLPTLWLDPEVTDIDKFGVEHIGLIDYVHQPAIKAPVAV